MKRRSFLQVALGAMGLGAAAKVATVPLTPPTAEAAPFQVSTPWEVAFVKEGTPLDQHGEPDRSAPVIVQWPGHPSYSVTSPWFTVEAGDTVQVLNDPMSGAWEIIAKQYPA